MISAFNNQDVDQHALLRVCQRAPFAVGVATLALFAVLGSIFFAGCGTTNAQPTAGMDAGSTSDGPTGSDSTSDDALTPVAPDSGDALEEPPPPPPDPVIPLPDGGTLRLEVWGPKTIRVLYGLTSPAPGASLAVNETRPSTPFTVSETATELTVATSDLQARVDTTSGQVTFLTPGGTTILAEAATTPHQLMQAPSGPGPYTSIGTFAPNSGELYYGLGEHQQQNPGNLTYTGTTQLLQKNPGESSIPLLFSSRGYGILWDNPSVLTVNVSGNIVMQSEVASLIDYYFMAGPAADDVVASYRALTGAAPMFGRWAHGYWQSHNAYGSQTELLNTAATYRSMQIPIDNIVQDWMYWGSNPWGSDVFDSNYPDPAGMFTTLHQTGFHAMLSVWARFATGSANYTALQSAGDFMTPALSRWDNVLLRCFQRGCSLALLEPDEHRALHARRRRLVARCVGAGAQCQLG